MSQGVINFIALLVEDYVGEIVILVDDEVEVCTGFCGMEVEVVQLADEIGQFFHLLCESGEMVDMRVSQK